MPESQVHCRHISLTQQEFSLKSTVANTSPAFQGRFSVLPRGQGTVNVDDLQKSSCLYHASPKERTQHAWNYINFS